MERELIKAEFDEKLTLLVANLQSIVSADHGKRLAGMTALGIMFKNISSSSPTTVEKVNTKVL